jgi:ribonuclease Z
MQVTILGSGSPIPDAARAGPATLVRAAGQAFLFDCGRGVLMRAAAAGVAPAGLTRVLLTHLHSDHTSDFNDVVTTRWVTTFEPNPLPVIGPPGTQSYADATLAMLEHDIGYRLAHHDDLNWRPGIDVTELAEGVAYEEGGVRITAAPTDHRPVEPTVGYRIEADGAVVVIAGDTTPCDGLDRLCAGADLYVQTVVRRSMVEAVPIARFLDILDYHSTIEDAADTAARAGVGTLVLNHPVPAPLPGTEDEWIQEARAVFGGEVVLAHDLLDIDLPG